MRQVVWLVSLVSLAFLSQKVSASARLLVVKWLTGSTSTRWVLSRVLQASREADPIQPREGLCIANSHDALYGPEMAAKPAEEMLRKTAPQGTKVFASPPGKPAWSDPNMKGRLGYIKCLHDKAVSVEGQAGMLQMTGQEWHVVDSDSGHSPFASNPVETARYCLDLLEKFKLAA